MNLLADENRRFGTREQGARRPQGGPKGGSLDGTRNVHRLIGDRRAADGHEVLRVGDLSPSAPDRDVLKLSLAQGSLLITNDLDFGELVYRGGAGHTGVLLLRLAEMPYAAQAELLSRTVAIQGPALEHAFSVLSPGRLRIRA